MIRQALGEEVTKQIKAVENYFIEKQSPWVFNPYEENCILVVNDKTFEEVCAGMEDSGIMNPKDLSTFEFYSKIAYLNKKAEKINSKL
ncbi:MAG: hypothetical protein WCG90_08180 [Chitinophagia bacterium]